VLLYTRAKVHLARVGSRRKPVQWLHRYLCALRQEIQKRRYSFATLRPGISGNDAQSWPKREQ
jgi:hypothetical protein